MGGDRISVYRVTVKKTDGDLSVAKNILIHACSKSSRPKKKHLVLQTPGGFICYRQELSGFTSGEKTDPQDFSLLTKDAEVFCRRLFDEKLKSLLKRTAHYMTLGVDIKGMSDWKHAELVGTYDTWKERFVYWTGKSHPTTSQIKDLIYCRNLQSHFQKLGGVKVLVIGCHDLNMFSSRAESNSRRGTYKWNDIKTMKRLAKKFKPIVVLQHPHKTDSAKIWATGWCGVRECLPSVKTYSSSINFLNGGGGKTRDPLELVLDKTKLGNVTDQDFFWRG